MRWWSSSFGSFLEAFKATTDVDGRPMLDNTLLLHMSDNGEHHHSNAEEWAMLLIGGDNLEDQVGPARARTHTQHNTRHTRQQHSD